MTNRINVPFNKLILSARYQARKTRGQMPLTEMAASIAAIGLLQNLVVVPAKKKGIYEVVAGGRRWEALGLLVKDGSIPDDHPVPCLFIDEEMALDASLIENLQREAMHPADEFDAFQKLVEQGKSVETIAATFGVTPAVVKRRLKLANVAPELIQVYRAGEMKLDVLMAFALVDDHERQKQVWDALPDWQRNDADDVREALTQEDKTADSRMARFVGLDAYCAAGGRTYSDLFAEEGHLSGIYLQDVDLLRSLAEIKLQEVANRTGAEGWKWVEVRLGYDYSEWQRYGRINGAQRKLTKAEKDEIKVLEARVAALGIKLGVFDESSEDDAREWVKMSAEHDEVTERITEIKSAAKWTKKDMEISGAVVSIGHDGKPSFERGLIRPEDRQAAQAQQLAKAAGETGASNVSSLPQANTRPTHSEKLVRQLTANKVGIVAAELAGKPDLVLALLVAELARSVFCAGYYGTGSYGLGISRKTEWLEQNAPGFADSKAGLELAQIHTHWLDQLPNDADGRVGDLLPWCVSQDRETLLELLAYIVGTSVQGIAHQEPNAPTSLDRIAALAAVDPANWWEPTADTYLGHVSKDRLIDVVSQAVNPEAAQPLLKMKKVEAIAAAEQALAGKHWLPAILKINVPAQQAAE